MAAQTERLKSLLRVLLVVLVLTVLVLLLLLMALVFVMLGVYQSLEAVLPAWQAGVMLGLGVLLLCLLVVAFGMLAVRRQAAPEPEPEPESELRQQPVSGTGEPDLDAVVELGASAGRYLSGHRPHGVELTAAAFLVGLVSSLVSRRRRD
ncbi:MAG: hypothetical protein ACODAC_07610 [Pseudomonadota bacterium]